MAKIDVKALNEQWATKEAPKKKFEGEYTRTELPKAEKPERKPVPELTDAEKSKRFQVRKQIKFSEDGGLESGLDIANMNVPKDPEPTRTAGNRGVRGKPTKGVIPMESSAAKPLIGRSNRNATQRNEQARILEEGTADEYWKHAIGTETLHGKNKEHIKIEGAAGQFTDLGATRGGQSVGGFCTNCKAPVADVEAAIPLPRKGPGGITRYAQSAKGHSASLMTPRDDSHCATCAPQKQAITAAGQQALSEKFNVQRPRG